MKKQESDVLILGGGFGGVKAALELAGDSRFEITLMSDQANFRFYPSLYRTATGGKKAASAIPLKEIFEAKKVALVKDQALSLDRSKQSVKGASGKNYSYDVLIIALGMVTNFFGIKGLGQYAFGIKTVDEAQALRQHIQQQLLNGKPGNLNYVVIGGGPTGVELAGALPEYIRHLTRRHNLKKPPVHVDLVEALPRLVPRMPKSYSLAVQKRLRRLGVKLYLKQAVKAQTADALMLEDHSIASHTVIWTAGVTNHPFLKANDFRLNDLGQAVVDQYLKAEDNIYVIGDNAGTPYSGMAQTALYDGILIAANLKRQASGKSPQAYKPKKPVYITPVGRNWAAVQWGGLHIYGWLGWVLRTAADFVAYHDLEPWWPASQHWMAESQQESEP